MNPSKVNISLLLGYFIFTMVLFSTLLQLSVPTIALLSDTDYNIELLELDVEEESDEEEKTEEESKDEKVEMLVLSFDSRFDSFLEYTPVFCSLQSQSNFSLEIPIPPPELG